MAPTKPGGLSGEDKQQDKQRDLQGGTWDPLEPMPLDQSKATQHQREQHGADVRQPAPRK
jgi:hypothetical protein